MMFGCPGSQHFKQPHPELASCPFCNEEVEIWTDEFETKCPKCGRKVVRVNGQCCLDWCRFAKECVGEKVYGTYLENKARAGELKTSKR